MPAASTTGAASVTARQWEPQRGPPLARCSRPVGQWEAAEQARAGAAGPRLPRPQEPPRRERAEVQVGAVRPRPSRPEARRAAVRPRWARRVGGGSAVPAASAMGA
jgi:hypothetical protein